MRIAVVADVHGNLAALEAVLADLAALAPDEVVHGGDLAFGGGSPAECVDRIRELGWRGVRGNTDEALNATPELWRGHAMAGEALALGRDLGRDRLGWLLDQPLQHHGPGFALVHAVPGDLQRVVAHDAADAEMQATYGSLGEPLAVYGHIHVPFVREMDGLTVANSGSVGLPLDGDPRAAYLVIEDGRVSIRRVEYDIDRAAAALHAASHPRADAIESWMRSGGATPGR